MRILIFTIGSAGDVHPFLGLGLALKNRGHEVRLFTSSFFEDLVVRAGLEFGSLGSAEDFLSAIGNPDMWKPRKGLRLLIREALSPSYETILTSVQDHVVPGNTVLVGSSLAMGIRNAQELLNLPAVTVHLAPSVFPSSYRAPQLHGAPTPRWAPRWFKSFVWSMGSRVTDHWVLPDLNRFRESHGLPPAKDVMGQWWNSPDRVLGLFPKWFAPVQPDWPPQLRLTGFPLFDEAGFASLPSALNSFLDQGEAPIVFTPGSAMAVGNTFFKESVGICHRLGARGVFLTRHGDTIPEDLPDSIIHSTYAPFSELLPRSAAMVYHGGVGTCAQALKAGIPHLIQHMAYDQLDNLSRVEDLGVGSGVSPRGYTSSNVAPLLDELLSSDPVRRRCKDLASRFDPEHWMTNTCQEIEAVGP